MEVILLCLTAILVARYAEKRSKAVSVAHAVLFAVILTISLFTTNIQNIIGIMEKICGKENYDIIRSSIYTPCIWFLSANLIIILFEAVSLLAVVAYLAVHVTKKLREKKKELFTECRAPRETAIETRLIERNSKIFLRYCRLLN